jgi:hypothetical protein
VSAPEGIVARVLRGVALVLSLLVVLGLGCGAVAGTSSSAASSIPASLDTAIFDPPQFAGADAALAFAHVRQTGATVARLILNWRQVAPRPLSAGADASDPGNPAYRWGAVDRQVALAVQAGLQPILCVVDPPSWARTPGPDGKRTLPTLRDPGGDLGKFALAVARRYSGTFQGLPRVRYWQAWNEPNVTEYISPQYVDGKDASPAIYRQIVNAVAGAVHSVHADNLVVAGSQSPFTQGDASTDPLAHHVVIPPMRFMRELLCMSSGSNPKPTCNDPISFDAWSHHPYTSGGPTHRAASPDDVSLGDLPQMKRLLDAAAKAGHIRSRGAVRFWVTEFSWDSRPPDSMGVPAELEAQWVSDALYRMWQSGVSLVTWFLVHDLDHFQSSLYFSGASIAADKPKPALAAFRFPFVGHVVKGRVTVWGRTPWGKPGRVLVEEQRGGTWKRLGIVQTSRTGIFTKTFGAPQGRYVRARVLGTGGLAARPFPLAGPKDMAVNPFGS